VAITRKDSHPCGAGNVEGPIEDPLVRESRSLQTSLGSTTDPLFGVRLGVVPFTRSYWVVPGRLLAGFYPASPDPVGATEKLLQLLAVGVRHVVNLTEERQGNYSGQGLVNYEPELLELADRQDLTVEHHRHPIRDLTAPRIESMVAILDDIDDAVRRGRPSYVHCWGGRGRTGTVVGCYLARHGMAVGDAALAMIRYLRRTDAKAEAEAPETAEQKDFVLRWPVGQ